MLYMKKTKYEKEIPLYLLELQDSISNAYSSNVLVINIYVQYKDNID